tara:strand:+ start:381 stop:1178 length:798 start_codon:yes stop_codon:yes gene_type:complete
VVQDKDIEGDESDNGEEKEVSEATFKRIARQHSTVEKLSKQAAIANSQSQANGGGGGDSDSDSQSQSQTQKDNAVNAEFPLLNVLFDPEDPVQTIENFFDFAFLIKENSVVQRFDKKTKRPRCVAANKNSLEKMPRKQLVLSLNMGELEQLAELLEPEGGGLGGSELSSSNKNSSSTPTPTPTPTPSSSSSSGSSSQKNKQKFHCALHRNDPLYAATTAAEQSDILDKQAEVEKAKQAAKRKRRSQTQTQSSPDKTKKKSQKKSK